MRYLISCAIVLGLLAGSSLAREPVPFRPLSYWQLRRQVAGMATVWGIGGPVQRRGGSSDAVKRAGPAAVPHLIRMLDDSDVQVRSCAVAALGFFPERSAESLPALYRFVARSEQQYALQGAGQTLDKLLPRDAEPPAELVAALATENPHKSMVAAHLILKRRPKHEAARAAVLAALARVEEPKPYVSLSADQHYPSAWHALLVLGDMPLEERGFARDALDRIAGFHPAHTSRYGDLHQFYEAVKDFRNKAE